MAVPLLRPTEQIPEVPLCCQLMPPVGTSGADYETPAPTADPLGSTHECDGARPGAYGAERTRGRELEVAREQMLVYANDLRDVVQAERRRRAELEEAHLDTIRALAGAIEARDPYTGGHGGRVAGYALLIGRELGWSRPELRALEVGGLLHDIGKIAIPDAVLRKQGPLDEVEWAQMRQHPTVGASLIGTFAAAQTALPAVLHHHERFDGRGYPDGLSGWGIPAVARIVSLADALDAMLTDRPYRKGLELSVAVSELERCAGTQFDPALSEVCIDLLKSGRLLPQQGS